MDVEKEVKGVGEVVVEKCGLGMIGFEDLKEPNVVNHDLSFRRDSIDNSYVFVGGVGDPVDVVTLPLDPVAGSESLIEEDNHVKSKEFDVIPNVVTVPLDPVTGYGSLSENDHVKSKGFDVISNGDTLEPSVLGSDATLVMKEEADGVLDAGMNLEMPRDGWSGNLDAESGEVQTDLVPSVLTDEDMASRVASTDSLEQPIGALATDAEADAVLETFIQPEKSQESKVMVLEENAVAGGSVELNGAPSFFGKCGDRTETIEEAVSGEFVESMDKHDSQGLELNMNDESRQCKHLERVALAFDDTRDEIKETMHIISKRSDELPRGLDSLGVDLVAGAESGQSEDLEGLALGGTDSDNHKSVTRDTNIETLDDLSLCQDSQVLISKMNAESGQSEDLDGLVQGVKDSDNHKNVTRDTIIETPVELSLYQDSQDLISKMNAESGEINDLENVKLDTNNTSKDNKETMDKIAETSDVLSANQDSRDMELEANSQSRNVSGSSDVKESDGGYKKCASGLEVDDKPIEVQGCVAMELKHDPESDISSDSISLSLDVRETGDKNLESKDKQCETSDDPTEVQGAPKTIEADGYQLEETESEKLNLMEQKDLKSFNRNSDRHESEVMVLEVPECQSGNENLERKDKLCETSDDLTELRGDPNTIEADGYQLEETESEKLNLKEKKDFESSNHNRDEHESEVMVSESPACQSLDVQIMKVRSDLKLESEKAQPLEEGGTAQTPGVVCQVDMGSKHESYSADIQGNLTNARMQQTINKTAVPETILDPALCQNEFDLSAPQLKEIVQEHDETCEQTDGSANILFGSLRTETEMNSRPVKSNGSFIFDCEDSTTDHEVENQVSTFSEATKFTDVVGICPVDDSLKTETKSKPGKNVEGFPSDCQDITIEHEIELQSPKLNSAECPDGGAVLPLDDTRSGNIELGGMPDNGVTGGLSMESCLANEAGLEAETSQTFDNRAKTLNIQEDDSHANNVTLASKLKGSSALGSMDVHMNSDSMVAMVLERSNKEGASNFLSGITEVKSAGDDLNDAVKIKEVNLISQDIGTTDESESSEVSAHLTGSSISATAAQELEEAMQRPFNFLVKLPRFDDEKLREQIRHAQLEVDEKTRLRDAFRVQIQNKRNNLHAFGVAYDAAGSEAMDARKLLKSTRVKIESLQSLIGRMKNAISVEDIDARIYNIEHRMQHETMSLKEEKQSIREIKQLKQHREYLSANIGSQDEIQQALDQKDQNEDRLKVLKKELMELKEKVSRAQAVAATAGKKCETENNLIQELQKQYRVANDVRQAAYENLLSVKKKLYEKHEHFRKYKDDVSAASDYAFSRNKIALNRLCAGQMETMMELWNNNEEFREEYVRCNLRSTVRRLGTVDGRALGPDEEPPMLPSYTIARVDRSTSYLNKKSFIVATEMKKKIEPEIATAVVAELKPVTEMIASVKQKAKMLERERFTLEKGLASSSGADVSTSINGENLQAKEDHESATRVEDSQKEVETANLKEQDRLGEIAKTKEALERKKLDDILKAKEALERKKRMAEKAQIRAELRAQKEAEQKEKEREKRLRKKERRRVGAGEASESNTSEIEQSSESGIETVVEPAEVKENSAAVARRPQKASQFVKQSKSKPIPPPLRNKNRRKLQQWMYVIVTSVLVIALFFVGNIGIFTKVRQHRSGL